MKKTKIAAIVACAALLVLGMAFTAMAANKWVFQNGGWYAVNKDGEPVEYAWVKGQDGVEYWAGEDGLWVTEDWVDNEDAEDAVYVGADGKRATGWQYIANDDEEVEEYGDYSWYYLTAKGKKTFSAGKSKDVQGNGNRYCFDSTGRMVSGWVALDTDGESFVELDPDDDTIDGAKYYCNGEDEGWTATGWVKLYAPKEDVDDDEFWFYFNKTTGLITKDYETLADDYQKKIDGYYYTFDKDGRMLTGFIPSDGLGTPASSSYVLTNGKGVAKDWVWAIPTDTILASENTAVPDSCDDETYHWFWFDRKGTIVTNGFTTGKTTKTYWALDPAGIMLSGLYEMAPTVSGKTVAASTWTNGLPYYGKALANVDDIECKDNLKYMYFGDEETDGSMKTGVKDVVIDGEIATMRFSKSFTDKYYVLISAGAATASYITPGVSVEGFNGGKYYVSGQILCGDEDDGLSIAVLQATHSDADSSKVVCAIPATTSDADNNTVINGVGYKVAISGSTNSAPSTAKYEEYTMPSGTNYCIVKADGTIVKKANGIKDADGNKYYVSDYRLTKIIIPD